jgi:hypothetical protein
MQVRLPLQEEMQAKLDIQGGELLMRLPESRRGLPCAFTDIGQGQVQMRV